MRWCARQPHVRIYGGAVGVGREGNAQKAFVPPVELVNTRGGHTEGARKVGRIVEPDEYAG